MISSLVKFPFSNKALSSLNCSFIVELPLKTHFSNFFFDQTSHGLADNEAELSDLEAHCSPGESVPLLFEFLIKWKFISSSYSYASNVDGWTDEWTDRHSVDASKSANSIDFNQFTLFLMNWLRTIGSTNQWADGWTEPHKEMHLKTKKNE